MKLAKRLFSLLLILSLLFGIGAEAWAGMLRLPAGVKTIGDEAFAGDTSLSEAVIPEGADSIGERAFADSSLSAVNLPASLSYIAEDAFRNTQPTVTATKGTYAYQWAAEHEMITEFVFNDHSAYEYSAVRAAFSDDPEIGLYHESWIRNYQIANYDALTAEYEGEPEWNVAFVGDAYGASVWYQIGEWAGDGSRAIDVMIDNEPDFPCTLQLQVSCTWGGDTVTGTAVLEYQETALPTGLAAPDEFHGLKVGEAFALRPTVTPAGYSFGDFEYCDLWTDMDCENWDDWEEGDCVRYIRPNEAGIFTAWLVKKFNNIQIRKEIRLYVENEDGSIPAPAPKLEEEYIFDMAVSVDDDRGYPISLDNRTLGISFDNMRLLREMYGEDCIWTFETVRGTELELAWTDQTDYFEFTVNNFGKLNAGDEALVEATLRWGDVSAKTYLRFFFYCFEMADQIEFEEDISLRVNETYRATVSITPQTWGEKYFLFYDVIGTDTVEKWSNNNSAFYLRAHQPGYYSARPHIHAADNVYIWGDVFTLRVFDADGSISDPLPILYLDGDVFEYGFMIGESEEEDGEGWIITDYAFSRSIVNLQALCSAYGDDPTIEWSCVHTGGMEVEFDLVPVQSRLFEGDACDILLAERPTNTGYTDFNLICSWNGHQGVQPCRLWFFNKPENLPHTNTLPDEITVTLGETVYVEGHFEEGEYDVTENYCWIEADSEYINVQQNGADPRILGIAGLREGTIDAYARVGLVANCYAQKPITIHVVKDIEELLSQLDRERLFPDENELTPAGLISEALAGNDSELALIREYNAMTEQENARIDDLTADISVMIDSCDGFQNEASKCSLTQTDDAVTYSTCGMTMIINRCIADSDNDYRILEQVQDGENGYFILGSENGDRAYLYQTGDILYLTQSAPKTVKALSRGFGDTLYEYFVDQLRELNHYSILIEDKIQKMVEHWSFLSDCRSARVHFLEQSIASAKTPALSAKLETELFEAQRELALANSYKAAWTTWRGAWAILDISGALNQLNVIAHNWETINLISDHGHPRGIDESYPQGIEMSVSLNNNIGALRILYGANVVGTVTQLVIACASFFGNPTGLMFTIPLQAVLTAAETRERRLLGPILRDDDILHTYVYGWVKNRETMQPVEGVNVTDGNIGVWTDKNGYYEIHVESGERVLYFRHRDFERGKLTTAIKIGEANQADDMLLDHTPNIQGTVKDSEDNPIEGATISCGDKSAVSDGAGQFSLYLPMGVYTLVCDKTGYIPEEEPVTTSEDAMVQVDFALRPGYEIWTRQDLEAVAGNLQADYILCADIDLSGAPWTPLPWFSGSLYGRGFTIQGMNVQNSSDGNAGLFAGLSGATIKNLNISDASVEVSVDASYTNTGVLCGNMVQNAAVSDSAFSGSITVTDGTVSGVVFAGGISGLANYGCFSDCQSSVDVEVNCKNSIHVGGLFGQMHSGSINRCSYSGTLCANQSGSNSSAQILVNGIGYSGSITGYYSSVSGSLTANGVDGEALAYGLSSAHHGENRASVSASSNGGRAYAVGVQDGTGSNNYGSVSAWSYAKNADAAGLNNCASSNNYGSISASSVYGDVTAVGVVGFRGNNNYGSTSALSTYGNYYAGSFPYGVE